MEFAKVAFHCLSFANIQCQLFANYQSINMRFKVFFKIFDVKPRYFGIIEQGLTLLVKEGGFLKMFLV